jgi:predicted O-methyltransferase YrrM
MSNLSRVRPSSQEGLNRHKALGKEIVMPRTIGNLAGRSLTEEDELRFVLEQLPKNGRMIEIGTFEGTSARWMSDQRPDIHILSIDPFPGKLCIDGNIQLWLKNRNPQTQCLFVGTFEKFVDSIIPLGTYDVIFIDGDHSYESTTLDLECALKIKGATIMGHDYRDPSTDGVKSAVDDFCKKHGFTMTLCNAAYLLTKKEI